MERHVTVLIAAGQRRSGGAYRIGTQHRQILEHDPQIPILVQKGLHRRDDAAAIGAAIVEELDQRDVAVRVAAHRRVRSFEQLALIRGDRLPLADRGGFRLTALQFLERLVDDLGLAQQIIPHDLLDLIGWQLRLVGLRHGRHPQHDASRQAGMRQLFGQSTHRLLAPWQSRATAI